MSNAPSPEHVRRAEGLVAEAHRNGGLAPVELDRFWQDQERARADPFARDCPQVPISVFSNECIFDELGIPADYYRLRHDPDWARQRAREYNDRAGKIVGRRVLDESEPTPADRRYPPIKELHEIFEASNEWKDNSYWLHQSATTPHELEALLDRVDKRLDNLRDFLLPENWETEKARLQTESIQPPLYRGQRGPVTLAMSIFGVENLIFLILDNPGLAIRLRDTILRAMLGKARIQDEEAGYQPGTAPRGFGFADDNCCLLTPDMYELFGLPILRAVFERYSPDPGDSRYQHSDSAMGHLLPLLAALDMTGVNLGPTVSVAEIRRHLPRAVIHGQLAPFTYCRNEEVNIVAEFLRDYDMARESRGLVFATAGSINNGSRLTGARLIMAAVQRWGRYDSP